MPSGLVLGDACRGWGAADIADGKYAAMDRVVLSDEPSWGAAMKEHGAEVMGDVTNHTIVRPEMLIGEIAGGSR